MSWIITYPPEYYLQLGGESVPTETRYIATLKASEGGYIKLAQPIELHAGDEVEWIGKTDYGSANRYLLDGHSSAYRCYVISGTNFSFNTGVISSVTFNDVVYTESFTNPNNGQVNSIKLTISAQCYIGTIGTSYTRVEFLDQAFLGLMVRRNGNVIHNISTDVAKGTTIIPNLAQPLGSELWNGVSTISNSSATSIATIETNELYLVNISEFTGNLQYASGAGWKQLRVGDNLISVTSGTSLSLQNFTQESTGVTFSVRKAPYWAEYINVTDDNKELYTWNAGRNAWVGEELWNTSTGYAVNTGASTSTYDGQVGHLQTLGDYTGFRQIDVQTIGATYLFSCEVFDVIDSGSGYLTLGESYGDGRNTPITPKLDAIFKADATYAQVKRAQGSYDLKLRNISFRHILEVAQ